MSPEGIYYSESDWIRHGALWAYRFYADGVVLFCYMSPLGLVIRNESGALICRPHDVLATKDRLPGFEGSFSRNPGRTLSHRSGLPGVFPTRYRFEKANIAFTHDYFGVEECAISGRWDPDQLFLSLTGTRTASGGEKKSLTHPNLSFHRLM